MKLRLTNRECQILELLAKGLSPEGISKKLFMERCSVYSFMRSIFIKYGLKANADYDRKILAIRKYLKGKEVENEL